MRLNRFQTWWSAEVVHTKGRLLGYSVCLFISGLIVGLSLLLGVQSYQLQALRKLPVNLRGVAYAQEKAQVYRVVVYNLFGRIVARFQGGVALWNRPELIKRLFIARFKPGTAIYIYRVFSPAGEYKQGKILVGENPDPGK